MSESLSRCPEYDEKWRDVRTYADRPNRASVLRTGKRDFRNQDMELISLGKKGIPDDNTLGANRPKFWQQPGPLKCHFPPAML
jgi:hypothetical protein